MPATCGSDPGAVDSRQLLFDIAAAEKVLLHHAEQAGNFNSCTNSPREAALRLITLLRNRAQRPRQPDKSSLAPSCNDECTADQPGDSLRGIDTRILHCRTALLPAFSDPVLSEICTILHSLYVREDQMQSGLPSSVALEAAAMSSVHSAPTNSTHPTCNVSSDAIVTELTADGDAVASVDSKAASTIRHQPADSSTLLPTNNQQQKQLAQHAHAVDAEQQQLHVLSGRQSHIDPQQDDPLDASRCTTTQFVLCLTLPTISMIC